MRIHTNKLGNLAVLRAIWYYHHEVNAPLPIEVNYTEHGSRSHERAFEIHLTGTSRRRPNFWSGNSDEFAATWDEWGVYLARLFEKDPEMVCGSVKNPIYASAEHYHWTTGNRFVGLEMPGDTHQQHRWQYHGEVCTGSYYIHVCKVNGCSALTRRTNDATAQPWAA